MELLIDGNKRKHLMHETDNGLLIDITVARKTTGNGSVPCYRIIDGKPVFAQYINVKRVRNEYNVN